MFRQSGAGEICDRDHLDSLFMSNLCQVTDIACPAGMRDTDQSVGLRHLGERDELGVKISGRGSLVSDPHKFLSGRGGKKGEHASGWTGERRTDENGCKEG